jgi:hypothetical protein
VLELEFALHKVPLMSLGNFRRWTILCFFPSRSIHITGGPDYRNIEHTVLDTTAGCSPQCTVETYPSQKQSSTQH